VVAYLRAEGLPVARFANLMPAGGVSRSAISRPEEARGYAQALLDAMRAESAGLARLHLFQAGPVGLSLLLGHVWNRLPETQLYEDLGAGAGYAPTFRLTG
jgi:SMODS-associated and fused to various effectors sensor domain